MGTRHRNLRHHRRLLLAALLTVLLAALPGAADESSAAPTRVGEVTAATGEGTLEVAAPVDWGSLEPVVVGEAAAGSEPPGAQVGRAAGVDLEKITIAQPDGNVDALEFTWHVAELNAPPPNEVVRYLWQLRADGEVFWLQAKSSDFTTATMLPDDPAGTATRLTGSFRLRGNCGPINTTGVTINSCGHLAWLEGEFDTEADEVRITVPLGTDVAEELAAGALLTNESSGAEAGFQALISNANTSKQVPMDNFTVPTRTATVELFDADGSVLQGTATTDTEGLQASVDVADLAAGDYVLHVTACFAGSCDTATHAVALP